MHSSLPFEGQNQLIAELLDRQDDVLNDLERLNIRIERWIAEISQNRRAKQQRQAQVATNGQESDTPIESDNNDLSEAA